MALNMDADGTVIINGPQGITGTPNDSTFCDRLYPDPADIVYRAEPDQFKRWTCDHGN